MDKELKSSLLMKDKWIRLLFMVIYGAVNYMVQMLILALSAIQFIFILFVGKPNANLLRFTEGLTAFSYHILRYLAYNIADKPYPFSAWSNKKP